MHDPWHSDPRAWVFNRPKTPHFWGLWWFTFMLLKIGTCVILLVAFHWSLPSWSKRLLTPQMPTMPPILDLELWLRKSKMTQTTQCPQGGDSPGKRSQDGEPCKHAIIAQHGHSEAVGTSKEFWPNSRRGSWGKLSEKKKKEYYFWLFLCAVCYMPEYVCVQMWRSEVKVECLFRSLPLFFWDGVASWTGSSSFWTSCLSPELEGSPCLSSSPPLRYQSRGYSHATSHWLLHGYWRAQLRFSRLLAGRHLLTEPCPEAPKETIKISFDR